MLWLILGAAIAHAFPGEPMLRVETGTHTDAINDIAIDDNNHYLVTGSWDRTVRVWSLEAEGALVTTLRPPIGPPFDGSITSVAITPGGDTIAVGGLLSFSEGVESNHIYVFDRASGAMTQRIPVAGDVTQAMIFASDTLLIYGTGGCGMSMVDLQSGESTASVEPPASSDHSVVDIDTPADPDLDYFGIACSDGQVRFYDMSMNQLGEVGTPDGQPPNDIAFLPSGGWMAVASDTVALYNTETWEIFSPQGVQASEPVYAVSWSADGSTLLAAGELSNKDGYVLRRWAEGGMGASSQTRVARSAVMALAPLGSGYTLYATADPGWGVTGPDGKVVHEVLPQTADFEAFDVDTFAVSNDGRVSVLYEAGGKPAVFSVADRLLTLDASLSGLAFPQTLTSISLNEEQGIYAIDGVPLMVQDDPQYLHAYVSDGTVLTAGSNSMSRFSSDGTQLWEIITQATAMALNVTPDGRYAVTAQTDGAIRWHAIDSGEVVLSLMPHGDKSRWALWTPNGFYDASPGGAELMGFHINHGASAAADFFPASVVADDYNRPDIIDHVLRLGSDIAAWEYVESLPAQELVIEAPDAPAPAPADPPAPSGPKVSYKAITFVVPPVVSILSPAPGTKVSGTVDVDVAVRSDDPVSEVKVLLDGRPMAADSGLKVTSRGKDDKGHRYTLTVPVPDREVKVAVLAKTASASGDPVSLDLCPSAGCGGFGSTKPAAAASGDRPNLYVLSIGVSDYATDKYDLEFPAKDANDFVAALMKQQGGMYGKVETRVLTDEAAKKDDILDALEWISTKPGPEDVATIFLSGHGLQHPQTKQYYFMPHDGDHEKVARTMVQDVNITSALGVIKGRVLLFMDTCHSGAALTANSFVNSLVSGDNGVVVFFSSSGRQTSQESPAWGNGAFTKAVVEGLTTPSADPYKTGEITVDSLGAYLGYRVKQITEGAQTPTKSLPKTTVDFPIVRVPQEG